MALTSQISTSLLQVDGRLTEGGVIEIVPGARLLLDVGVEEVEPGALLDDIAAAVAEAQAARDAVEGVVITDLGTTDGQTKTLVETNGTLTKAALTAGYGRVFGVDPTYGNATTEASTHIQARLDAANTAGGGIVDVQAGVYKVTTPLTIGSNTHLRGNGTVVFRRGANAQDVILLNKYDGTTGGYAQAKNITISGIEFDANGGTFTGNHCNVAFGHAENIVIDRCHFRNNTSTWHLLEINAARNVTIRNSVFSEHTSTSTNGTEMIQLDLPGVGAFPWFGPQDETVCENVVIEDCEFLSYNVSAIGSHSVAPSLTKFHHDITIRRCYFKPGETAASYAIKSLWWYDTSVEDNTVVGGLRGFVFNGADTTRNNKRLTIRGNTVRDTGHHAIGFDYCDKVIVSNNTIVNCGNGTSSVGIYCYFSYRVQITGNIARDNKPSSSGDILVGPGTSPASPGDSEDVSIIGNVVDRIGVRAASNRVVLSGNVVTTAIDNASTTLKRGGNMTAGAWDLGSSSTFTPTVAGATTAGTATYTAQSGRATIDDKLCRVSIRVAGTFDSTIAGQLTIAGLPVPSAPGGANLGVGQVGYWALTGITTTPVAYQTGSSSSILLGRAGTGSLSNIDTTALRGTAFEIWVNLTYEIA